MSASGTIQYDVVIVGGGLVGLTLANCLRDSGLHIAVVERQPVAAPGDEVDIRVSAINRASIDVFSRADVWHTMQQRAAAFREMVVWDSGGAGSIHFDSADVGLDSLGYIIENSVIQHALYQGVSDSSAVDWLCPAAIQHIEIGAERHQLWLDNDKRISSKLLVGADGARSRVRQAAGIAFKHASYRQQGIVCTVGTEYSHEATAWQCFHSTGPLAFLPLFDGRSSIVWSMDEARVAAMLALDDDSFCRQLEAAFEYRLGAVTGVGRRAAFPLGHGHVEHYVRPGLALVGDAAHTIHPLAGQGANLGFMDAACLADVILHASTAGRQWHALHTLRKYERARKGDNRLMENAMTGFKLLFGSKNPLLAEIRNTGLIAVDQLPLIKQQFMHHALGV